MRSLESLHDSIGRARELVTSIRTGRVRADARVVARLCEYLDDLAAITDEQYPLVPEPDEEQARLRDALLAEVPASQRTVPPGSDEMDLAAAVAAGLAQTGDGTCVTVTEWLRAARRDGAR